MKRLPWLSLVLLLACYAGFGWYLSELKNQPAWMKSSCERVFAPIIYNLSGSQESQPNPVNLPADPKATGGELKSPEPAVSPSPGQSPAAAQPEAAPEKPAIAEAAPEKPTDKTETLSQPTKGTRDTTFVCGIIVRHNVSAGLLAIAWIVLSSLAFISPLTSFSAFVTRWFTSDTVAFMTIITVAGMAAVILYWLHVFLQILTILAADTLARIDLQAAGLSGLQAFWIMVLVSLTGLIAGWLFSVFVA